MCLVECKEHAGRRRINGPWDDFVKHRIQLAVTCVICSESCIGCSFLNWKNGTCGKYSQSTPTASVRVVATLTSEGLPSN